MIDLDDKHLEPQPPEADEEPILVDEDNASQLSENGPFRRRILRGIFLLPAFFTVMNGVFGFGAIHFATKDAQGSATLGNLAMACWLIVASMLCDMLDGRVARMTRRTTDFGAQLDSLCDAVSFGVAPAILAVRTVTMAIENSAVSWVTRWAGMELTTGRLVWCIAAIYVACAVLRLARFNVENEPDESSHMMFEGLPTPAAAAAVIGMVLLMVHAHGRGWGTDSWLLPATTIVLPLLTLCAGLLMVSRVTYPHLVNQLLRSKRPFNFLVKLTIVAVLMLLEPMLMLAGAAVGFVMLGVVRAVFYRHRRRTHADD
ncbi:MAG: CDP-alcohol phosphatidyltransferase family protein [Phycisphaerae bacterium]